MQTTLLGIAIVIILALVTALVGPLFVDWNRYRGQFEAEASRLTGLTVRVSGPIDARLLPTPTLTLQKVDISQPGEASGVRAGKIGIEFALGALMRGEWRATDVRVEGAEFALGLDAEGRLDWPAPKVGFDPDAISVQRLDVVDSRALIANGMTGSGVVLDKFEFRGELRSLLGPLKGEGAFVLNGQHYPFRVAVGRPGDDGAVRVRLDLDPIDRPLIADADAMVRIEDGVPHFEGTMQMARPVGRAAKGTSDLIVEPWRIASRIKGDSRAAVLEQIEFQYGPDDRAIKLKGDARLSFGRKPQLAGVLSSTQIDLDRMLALPEAERRRPFAAVKAFTDYVAGTHSLPIPVKLGISVEQVTLAGATLQRLSGDVKTEAAGWDIESLDFRAPGAAQVRLSGRLGVSGDGLTFAGRTKVEALDPRVFVSWLTDRADAQGTATGPLRAEGDVKLENDAFAIERLTAELDRMTLQGRLAYAWADGAHPARLETTLSAPDLDLDRAQALVQGLFGAKAFQWPREGVLAIKVDRASFGGIEASGADIHMRFDNDGLDVERLAVADLGGARLAVKGHIDTRTQSPRGTMDLTLDARSLDGVVTLAEKVAPQFADALRRKAGSLVPATLHATLAVNSQPSIVGNPNTATFRLDGGFGSFKIGLKGDAGGGAGVFAAANLGKLAATKLNLAGHVDADDGSALVEFLGLDRLLAVGKRAGRLNFNVRGSIDGDMALDGALTAGDLDLSTKGNLRLRGSDGTTAALVLKVTKANLRSPRKTAPLPAILTAKLALAERTVAFTDLNGEIGGTGVAGQVRIGLAQPATIEGDLQLASINLPAAVATIIGVPPQPAGKANVAAVWPADPFETGLFGSLEGEIKVKLARVALTPKLTALDVHGVLNFDQSVFSFEQIDGALAGGRITGELTVERGPDGLTARTGLRLAGADAGELMPGDGPGALAGHLTLAANVEGSGRSAVALAGSLKGAGTFTLQDGRVAALDPSAFDVIIRKADLGLPIDVKRIKDGMEPALAAGALAIPLAEGEIVLTAGQARITNVAIRAGKADLTVTGSIDLAQSTVDARLLMQGPAALGSAGNGRPGVGIVVKGPLAAPKRTLDVAALTNWLSLRQIEQQTKRIESLESGRESPAKPADKGTPVSTAPTDNSQTPAQAPSPQTQPAPNSPAKPALTPPREVRTTPAPRPRPPRQVAPEPSGPHWLRELFGLPPPVDIRPPSAPRG